MNEKGESRANRQTKVVSRKKDGIIQTICSIDLKKNRFGQKLRGSCRIHKKGKRNKCTLSQTRPSATGKMESPRNTPGMVYPLSQSLSKKQHYGKNIDR